MLTRLHEKDGLENTDPTSLTFTPNRYSDISARLMTQTICSDFEITLVSLQKIYRHPCQ